MNLMLSSILVLLLYAVPTKSTNTMDERVDKLETFVREQSIQLVEQNRKVESTEGVIVKQQNEIKELTQQLAGVVRTSRIQYNDISLLKKILRSQSNYSEQKRKHPNTALHPENIAISQNTQKRSMIRESNIPLEGARLTRALTGTTAFYAYMSNTESSPSHHHTFIFDVIITNINNAYSHYTGTFMAPSAGIYVFTSSITMGCNAVGGLEFVHNAQIVGSFYSQDHSNYKRDTITGTIALNVNHGDVIFVRTHGTNAFSGDIESGSWGRSSFCGWSV